MAIGCQSEPKLVEVQRAGPPVGRATIREPSAEQATAFQGLFVGPAECQEAPAFVDTNKEPIASATTILLPLAEHATDIHIDWADALVSFHS